jgi:hypothetical protein
VLFEKVVFVWNKGAQQLGGVLHKDYLTNWRAKIAGGKLMNATDSEAETYMNLLSTIWYRKTVSSVKYSTTWWLLLACYKYMCYCDCVNTKTIGLLNYRHFHCSFPMQRCAVQWMQDWRVNPTIDWKLPNEIETPKG